MAVGKNYQRVDSDTRGDESAERTDKASCVCRHLLSGCELPFLSDGPLKHGFLHWL